MCAGTDSSYNENNSPLPDTVFSKATLIKTNINGEIIFRKSYSFGNEYDGCWSNLTKSIFSFDNKNYSIGKSNDFSSNTKPIILKTDSLGNDSLSYISEPQASPISRYELEVYPNPVSDQLYINIPANFPGGDMQIINQQGQIVNTIHLPRHEQSPAEINVSSYPPGHYLIQIKTNGNYFYGKFMKN